MILSDLPSARRVLAVVAHPDDESFGLGAVLSAFVDRGTIVGVVCFTRGEASTLGADVVDLATVRENECRAAASILGIEDLVILDYPDGGLESSDLSELVSHIEEALDEADLLVVFDQGGITGHPDHQRATDAAMSCAATKSIPVLAWTVPLGVANQLRDEFGAGFVGRLPQEIDIELVVGRARQIAAIGCHQSQSHDNPVLWRRLDLQEDREYLRFLTTPDP